MEVCWVKGKGRGGRDSEAKAAQIISHHLSVKIRILNKRATQNYHGPGIKAAFQTRDSREKLGAEGDQRDHRPGTRQNSRS